MTQRILRLSNSEMATWRRCHRKWYLGVYRKLQRKRSPTAGTPIVIGNLVHDALAEYYDPALKTDPLEQLNRVLDQRAVNNPFDETDIEKDRALVTIMLEGYLEWLEESGADQEIEILGTERMVEVPIVKSELLQINLLSKLDAPVLRHSDEARLAFEHKTVGSLTDPLPTLKLDTQLLTEHLALFLHNLGQGMDPIEAHRSCQGILYNMLRKVKRTAAAKPPFYDRVEIPHNLEELRNHWRHVVGVAREIDLATRRLDAGENHHAVTVPNPTKNCSWDCPFFAVCVMADDGSDFEGALDDLFEERDPLERYEEAEAL